MFPIVVQLILLVVMVVDHVVIEIEVRVVDSFVHFILVLLVFIGTGQALEHGQPVLGIAVRGQGGDEAIRGVAQGGGFGGGDVHGR